jgi:tripartite-type tricarboxylate transporter receptor subunit TctC
MNEFLKRRALPARRPKPGGLGRRVLLQLGAVALAAPLSSWAQESWPSKSIRLVVPTPAGGGTDNMARTTADRLRDILKATIVVENRAGATTAIGNEFVALAPPDGYTFLFVSPPGFTAVPHLRPVKYELSNFEMVGAVGNLATMLVVRKDLPVNNLREFIDLAKKQPGKLTYGTAGVGSLGHLVGEVFRSQTGIDVLHVPFKGSADAIAAAMGGHVDFIVNDAAQAQIRDGRLKGLAVFGDQPVRGLPQVLPIKATGVEVSIPGTPMGFMAPRGTPKAIVDRVAAALETIAGEPAFQTKMAAFSLAAQWIPPAEYLKLMEQGYTSYGEVIRRVGIKE